MTVYLITLGCEKNTVDAEHIIALLKEKGYTILDNPEEAETIIVNTCAFIEDAKKESIETIFDHTLYKKYGKCKRLVVSGCMSERYKNDFLKMFPEVDSAIGIHDLSKIFDAIEKNGYYEGEENKVYKEYGKRENTGSKFSAYIRISDGCHAACSFCAIPAIRGTYRSRTVESIVEEAKIYAKNGVKEINLIAQETTFYGVDLYKKFYLPELLTKLSEIDTIEWIRVLYQNPVVLSDEIIKSFFETKKVVPYFDIPLQHVNARVLKNMNRAGSYESNKKLIEKIRSYSNDAAIRTSFIVGFPGETKDDFKELLRFVKECEIDRLGVFTYSEEEGTKASLLDEDRVNSRKKLVRRERLMESAIKVSSKRLSRFVGKSIDVFVERLEASSLIGRSMYDAPEVDGVVYIENYDIGKVKIGDIVSVNVTHNNNYDLFASF